MTLLASTLAACGGSGATPGPVCTVTGVAVSASPASLPPGGTATLDATLSATAGCSQVINWSVSPGGGTLTPGGASATFTSTTAGTYTITATSGADPTKSGAATVTVAPAVTCTVTGVTVSATPGSVEAGASASLTASLSASAGCDPALEWSVTPGGGVLTASGTTATFSSPTPATYTITAASVADPTKSGTTTVTVTAPQPCTVTGVVVTAGPASIPSGGTTVLTGALTASATCSTALEWSVSPGGGTLTPTGGTASFTSTIQGTYTVTAASVADPTKSGSATVTVTAPVPCGLPNGTEVTHRGDILADEIWAGDGVTHRVPASVQIRGSAVVTIEACALVLLGPRVTVSTYDTGRLVSAGTGGGRRVTFSAADSLFRWGMLRANSATSLIDLRFTTLREGGELNGIFFDTTLAGVGAGYDQPPAKVLRVIGVDLEGSSGIGVYLDFNATFTDDSTGLTIVNAGSNPVYGNMMSMGGLPSGSYVGNAKKQGADEILVRLNGDVFADMTLKDLGVPYTITVPAVNVRPAPPATAPVTLTVQPGVVLQFPRLNGSPGSLVTFGDAASGAGGVLSALGTAAKPILFTSGQPAPAPGDWTGLWLASAAGSRLDNVDIRFAGAPNAIASSSCRPLGSSTAAALTVGGDSTLYVPPADLLTNSFVTDSAGHGINANWKAASVNAPVLTGTNTFTANGGCSQTFNGVISGACPANACTTN